MNFKVVLLFPSIYPVPEVDYFSAYGIGDQSCQGGYGKYALQHVEEEDFPAASASGPWRDRQTAIELCRENNQAFGTGSKAEKRERKVEKEET